MKYLIGSLIVCGLFFGGYLIVFKENAVLAIGILMMFIAQHPAEDLKFSTILLLKL